MQTQLEISGMMCAACAGHVTKALQNVPQVRAVHVKNDPDIAVVEHDDVDTNVLIAAVEDEGYTAQLVAGT